MNNAIAAAEPVLCAGGVLFLIFAAVLTVRTKPNSGGTK